MLIDVHTHLDHELFNDDLDEVIQRAKDNGVKIIINNGIDPRTNRISLELSKKYDIMKCAMGIYPIDALGNDDNNEEAVKEKDSILKIKNSQLKTEDSRLKTENSQLKTKEIDVDSEIDFIRSNKKHVVAIGEVGLDLKNGKDIDMQKEVFSKMILLAQELDIPIIVHSRKAELECIELLEKHDVKKVIMHCFGGKKALVKRCLLNKWYFSIPPNCVRSEHFQNIIKMASINQLLTETDAPYLGPEPGNRNEPSFVKETIKVIARIKSFEEKEVENNIFMNYQRLF